MESLYDFVQEVLNESSIEKAKARVFGLEENYLNDIKYYESIISHFVRKKDLILSKTTYGEINYDLNKDIKDIWDIVFIAQYIYKCWNEEVKLLNKEFSRLKSKSSRTKEEDERINKINSDRAKINEYFQKLNGKLKDVNIKGLDESNSNILEKEILELKKAIVVFEKIRNSFEHRNNFSASDGNININNEKASFVVTIPAEYIDGFNKGRIIVKGIDKELIEKTNNIVYPLLKALDYDPKKLESFFYNIEPSYLEYLLELIGYDIGKLYSLPLIIFEKGDNLKYLINTKGYSLDDILKNPALLIYEQGTVELLKFFAKEKLDIELLDMHSYGSRYAANCILNYENTIKCMKYCLNNGLSVSLLLKANPWAFQSDFEEFKRKVKELLKYKADFNDESFYRLLTSNINRKYIFELINSQLDLKKVDFKIINNDILYELFDNLKLNVDVIYEIMRLSKDENMFFLIMGNIRRGIFHANSISDVTEDKISMYGGEALKKYVREKGYKIDIDNLIKKNSFKNIAMFHGVKYQKELIDFFAREKFNIEIYGDQIARIHFLADYSELNDLLKKYNCNSYLENGEIPVRIIDEVHKYRELYEYIIKKGLNLCAINMGWLYRNNIDNMIKILEYGKNSGIDSKAIIELNIMDDNELIPFLNELVENMGVAKTEVFLRACTDISNMKKLKKISDLVLKCNINADNFIVNSDGFSLGHSWVPISANYTLVDRCFNNLVDFIETVNKIDKRKLNSKMPKLIIRAFDKIKKENVEYMLKYVNTVDELEKYPIDFFTCDISLMDEMFKRYNINVCKSIFGIDNPKIIASLVYMNSVLSKTDKNYSMDLLDVDPIRFIHDSYNDTIRYTKTTTDNKVNMDQECYLTQFVLNDKKQVQRTNDEIKNHIIEKLRNSCAHFRFKLVRDQNNNILEDKIYLYDEYNNGINNFNIVVNIRELVEIVREVEIEYNKREEKQKHQK